MTNILSYAGYRQEVLFLLFNLAKRTQRYAIKNHDKLAPFLVEGRPIIERYLSGDKKCMQNYSEGRQKRKELGELKFDRKLLSDNIVT